jgi:hypothetical protein
LKGREIQFETSKSGEFWRILLPGIYKLEIKAHGFLPKEVEFAVLEDGPTVLEITLISIYNQPNASSRSDNMIDRSLNRKMWGPFKNPKFFDRKDIKNLIEWSFSLLNIINLLNIVSFLQ